MKALEEEIFASITELINKVALLVPQFGRVDNLTWSNDKLHVTTDNGYSLTIEKDGFLKVCNESGLIIQLNEHAVEMIMSIETKEEKRYI